MKQLAVTLLKRVQFDLNPRKRLKPARGKERLMAVFSPWKRLAWPDMIRL